ncbi:MAG TPA: S41 family peptidase, partial [Polyangiaceae bacterium]|nr:S41 family peptidase [Polyangiaceae bacterium]
VQYGATVTAIQLGDTLGWIDVARQGVEHACKNSKRLIIDLRGNDGGSDTVIRWLHHYLLPEKGALVPAGMIPIRLRNDNPVFNEILFNFALFAEEFIPTLDMDPCVLGVTPECVMDIDRGTHFPRSMVDWALVPTHHERRGGALLSLSREFGLPPIDAVFDSASCAGRFNGDNLVLLTNGSNASGGYFLPAAFKGEGVIVNSGGIVSEPMAMGRARGGATVPGSVWSDAMNMIESLSQGQISFQHELVGFTRPVDTQMEMFGAYRKDRRALHIDHPIEADLHVNVWANQLGSEGYVYERVLRAVDERKGCSRGK